MVSLSSTESGELAGGGSSWQGGRQVHQYPSTIAKGQLISEGIEGRTCNLKQ